MSNPSHAWRSQRLVFKGIEPEDDDFLFEMRTDSEACLNSGAFLPAPPRREGAKNYREFLQKCSLAVIICLPSPSSPASSTPPPDAAKPPARNTAPFTKPPKETLIPIGDMHLRADSNPLAAHHRNAEIGIGIHRDYQGQGYGGEAIKWVLEFAFRRANLHRVGIGHFAWNEGAGRLYQRLGFTVEGRMREVFWHDGAYRDLIEMGMLKHEWEALQSKSLAATTATTPSIDVPESAIGGAAQSAITPAEDVQVDL